MSSSNGRGAGVIGRFAAILATAFGLTLAAGAAPAGAARRNPCTVLRRSEIQQAFGGTVGPGRRGPGTPVSAQCEYLVGAAGDRPAGTVVVHLVTKGAKDTYGRLGKTTDYAPVDGVDHGLSSEQLHVVTVLRGKVLLGVQGAFTITDPLPIHFYDDRTQLIDLAQAGGRRV